MVLDPREPSIPRGARYINVPLWFRSEWMGVATLARKEIGVVRMHGAEPPGCAGGILLTLWIEHRPLVWLLDCTMDMANRAVTEIEIEVGFMRTDLRGFRWDAADPREKALHFGLFAREWWDRIEPDDGRQGAPVAIRRRS
jgi:hypothetical protein